MDKVNTIIATLDLHKPKNEKFYNKNQRSIEKTLLQLPKHIDTLINEIKKGGEDITYLVNMISLLYNNHTLQQHCEDRYIVSIIIMMEWLSCENNSKDNGDPIYVWENEDNIIPEGIKDCYDLFIKKIFDEHYPTIFKDISGNSNVVIYDMRIKTVKFDYVYENIFGSCDKSTIKNKYQHKSQLKKKFLKGEETYENGKIDYQLVMFNRLFDLEMRLNPN